MNEVKTKIVCSWTQLSTLLCWFYHCSRILKQLLSFLLLQMYPFMMIKAIISFWEVFLPSHSLSHCSSNFFLSINKFVFYKLSVPSIVINFKNYCNGVLVHDNFTTRYDLVHVFMPTRLRGMSQLTTVYNKEKALTVVLALTT